MYKKIILSSLLVAAGSLQAAVTLNVFANSGSGLFRDSSSSTLSVNSLLRVGTFDAGLVSADKTNIAEMDALFTEITTLAANASGEFFSVGNNISALATTGEQLYVWVFNAPTTIASTEWGVFSSDNVLWDVPADPGSATVSSATINEFVYGSVQPGSPNSYLLQAVPESSTYAAIVGLSALGFVLVRRRN